MRTLLFIGIFFLFYSCWDSEKQVSKVISKPAIISNDTFISNVNYQMNIHNKKLYVPARILFDTIVRKIKNGKVIQSVVIPRLTENSLSSVDNILRKKISEASNRFLKDEVPDNDKEYNKELKSGEIMIRPQMIYKDQKIINYCFELEYYDNILVRPYNEYYSVTYDLIGDRLINAAIFFKTKTSNDSPELSNFILRGIDPPLENDFNFVEIDFSMDDSVVYFFTDQYQLGIPFNSSCGIRKKYLTKFIKDEYK